LSSSGIQQAIADRLAAELLAKVIDQQNTTQNLFSNPLTTFSVGI
jgi:hypothetical protein